MKVSVAGGAGCGSSRRACLAAALGLAFLNCIGSWILWLSYYPRHTAPVGEFGLYGWLHLPAAFISNVAVLHLLVFLLYAGLARLPRLGAPWFLFVYHALVLVPLHAVNYIDAVVFTNHRMHINGAIIEMLLTPGVGDLFAFPARDFIKFFGVIAALAAAQIAAAFWLLRGCAARPELTARWRRVLAVWAAVALGLLLFEKGLYAWADGTSRRAVLVNARVVPAYLPATCKHLLRRLGVKVDRQHGFDTSLSLRYPLEPVEPPAEPRRYNIVWIAVEGWRVDALCPEVSPRLSRFAARCLTGERHYSTGNCTRLGIFGMLYGLEGFYWHPMLSERRGPVLVNVLRKMDYRMLAMGAANFNNPEFRLTCFVEMPEDEVVHGKGLVRGPSHERDREITERFARFVDGGGAAPRPFFCFMFLDSTHAPYHFQELPGFRPPFSGYESSVRYELLAGHPEERRQAFVRYRNSAAYVDHLLGGVVEDLERRGLLESTIVMISGDHGEEFGETGLFGHNGSFNDHQVRTPFIFHHPGVRPGRIAELTSHADWAPTVLSLLGVTAPPGNYSQGRDLLGGAPPREYVVAGSFSSVAAIADDGWRMAFPFDGYRMSTLDIYDGEGRPPADRSATLARHAAKLRLVLEGSRRFKK
jgi:hypothetical protein